ncbi:MAG: hypothetical protein M1827_002373 [Pycnora praestabilis]|nr:MAG: hypothetical protein M1827_002373 [Pycnora praestabilis]
MRTATYYCLRHQEYTLGYILPSVAKFFEPPHAPPVWQVDHSARTIRLARSIEGPNAVEQRSEMVAATTSTAWRTQDTFEVLRGWRDELYPVYAPRGKLLFNIERAASPLFGVVTYGVHMTAFVRGKDCLRIWVPRRAKDKQTYGGMLDNTVAGGISTGEGVLESLVREAREEASLPEGLVRKGAKACGTVTYFYVRDARAGGEAGLLQPECQYIYEIELGDDDRPSPGDDEVEDFYLWDVPKVQTALRQGEFKPNCALVLLDFFVRHGILTPENEKDYIEIVSRIHRRLEFPTA